MEGPKKPNLEYSRYDEPTPELDALDKETENRILEAQEQIEQLTAKIEKIQKHKAYRAIVDKINKKLEDGNHKENKSN